MSLKALVRMRAHFALVSENKLILINSGYFGLYSYGVHWDRDHGRLSLGAGFVNSRDFVGFTPLGLPYFTLGVRSRARTGL